MHACLTVTTQCQWYSLSLQTWQLFKHPFPFPPLSFPLFLAFLFHSLPSIYS